MMNKLNLTGQAIEKASETVSAFLQSHKVASKDVLRVTLALEDTLLNYRDAFGEKAEVELSCVQRFGRLRVELTVKGESFNPFKSEDDEDFSRILMSGIGMAPAWQYKNGQNVIIFTPKKKKPSQMVYIALAVALALICGFASTFLPRGVQDFISGKVFTPVFDTFLGLLNGVAGIMIFLSVTWGICSIGDISTLSTIGKKMISRMLTMMVLLSAVYAVCILPLFSFAGGRASGSVDLAGPFGMILGIIPTNMLTPFTQGNFLQIIFIAAMVGISLLVLGNKTSLVTSFVEQANTVVQLIMEVICSGIALVVFISLYNMVLSDSFMVLVESYKALLLILLSCIFTAGVYTLLVCAIQKVRPGVFLRKAMPAFLIGLTTASSSAAMSTNMDTCENRLGIDRKIVNFGIPLGQILCSANCVIHYIVIGFCMAEIYGIAVTPLWIAMAIVTSVILTVATPPIPGGGAAICAILFSQLGLPPEGIAIAVAIDVITDFVITASEIFSLQAELVILSGGLDMLDSDTLRSAK